MSAPCLCDFGNTGLDFCIDQGKDIVGVAVVDLINSDGDENSINLATIPVVQTAWEAYFQNADPTKRFYLLGTSSSNKEVALTPGDDGEQTFTDGTIEPLEDGVQSYTAFIKNAQPLYKQKIESHKCGKKGVVFIDSKGGVYGRRKAAEPTKIFPIPFDGTTLKAKYQAYTVGSTVGGINISFSLSRAFRDYEIGYFYPSNFEGNLNDATSLLDAYIQTVVADSTTQTTVKIVGQYGDGARPNPALGLTDDTDLIVVDSLGATLAIASIVDASLDGNYVITHADSGANIPVSVSGGATMYAKGYEVKNTVSA